jgi:Holliday junction resolvasome RuvABC endonuclease subunit
VKKSKQNEWEKRLETLTEQIDYWLENKTDKMVEIIQLFYDI